MSPKPYYILDPCAGGEGSSHFMTLVKSMIQLRVKLIIHVGHRAMNSLASFFYF